MTDSKSTCDQHPALTPEHVDQFVRDGVVVVENVLSPEEVAAAVAGMHDMLLSRGVDPRDLESTAHHLTQLSSTHGAGGVLDVFYGDWKFKVMQHPRVLSTVQGLWEASYAKGKFRAEGEVWNADDGTVETLFAHPHGAFNPHHGYFYIDRIGFRVPDTISQKHGKAGKPLQRCLAPHVDCCPVQLYGFSEAAGARGKRKLDFPRWRPIQSMVILSDNLEPNNGGFECVKGFHKEFDAYFSNQLDKLAEMSPVCVGEFGRLRPGIDADVLKRFEAIPAKAGSMILWDFRLPHANARHHVGSEPREVIYTGHLPPVAINKAYALEQLRRFRSGLMPIDVWHEQSEEALKCAPPTFEFSALGRKFLAMDEWDAE